MFGVMTNPVSIIHFIEDDYPCEIYKILVIILQNAEWNLRAKTKFLKFNGLVAINSFEDEVIAKQDEAKVAPFHFRRMTDDEESWTHVQATYCSRTSVHYQTTKISFA